MEQNMLAYYALQGGGRRRFFGGKNISCRAVYRYAKTQRISV